MLKPKIVVVGEDDVVTEMVTAKLCSTNLYEVIVASPDPPPHCSCSAQWLTADLSDNDATNSLLQGVFALFVNLPVNFTDTNCKTASRTIGKNLVSACTLNNVQRVIYCTATSPFKVIGVEARHFDVRAQVEILWRESGLQVVYVMLPFIYEYLLRFLKPNKIGTSFAIGIPCGTVLFDTISATDVGEVVVRCLRKHNEYVGKTLGLTSGKLTVDDMSKTLTEVLGIQFVDKRITFTEFENLPFPGALDWANAFQFVIRTDQQFNKSTTELLNPQVQTFRHWAENNRKELLTVFSS